jgi:hypothetical protein
MTTLIPGKLYKLDLTTNIQNNDTDIRFFLEDYFTVDEDTKRFTPELFYEKAVTFIDHGSILMFVQFKVEDGRRFYHFLYKDHNVYADCNPKIFTGDFVRML